MIKKRTTVEMNYKFVELCNKYEIKCKAFILLGLPGEDEEKLKDLFQQLLDKHDPEIIPA